VKQISKAQNYLTHEVIRAIQDSQDANRELKERIHAQETEEMLQPLVSLVVLLEDSVEVYKNM